MLKGTFISQSRFVYPNADIRNERFIGCGRLAGFRVDEEPEDGYEIPDFDSSELGHVSEAASILVRESVDSNCYICEKKDDPSEDYRGDSLDLAYLLATISCSRTLTLRLSNRDIWCTGCIEIAGATPLLQRVFSEPFRVKLEAFLSNDNLDPLFIVPDVNIDQKLRFDLHLDRREDVRVASLKDLPIHDFSRQKIILRVCRNELPVLVDALFKAPHLLWEDWGNALDVPFFFGRTKELETLEQWIVKERCRLITILGMGGTGKTRLSVKLGKGGIGKTNLSLKLAHGIKDDFEYIVWRSLLNEPPITELLSGILKSLSKQQDVHIPKSFHKQISQVLEFLRNHRCLLILDNVETVLQGGERVGGYREGYEEYGRMFRQTGEVSHKSCLILTSREKPREIIRSEGKTKPVRTLELKGLDVANGRKLVEEFGNFSGSKEEWKALINYYDGNPLALELAAKHISEVFCGNITEFLCQGKPIFGNIQELLDWHFERLSPFEQEVVYWLAINRELLSFGELQNDLLSPESRNLLSSTLQSLGQRIPLERNEAGFTVQPVLLEYLTDHLIDSICHEIQTEGIDLFNRYAIMKTSVKDYVRESQRRRILNPIKERLWTLFGGLNQVKNHFRKILSLLQKKLPQKPGYAGGNILNLLCEMESEVRNHDFSYLSVWQADLRGKNIHDADFSYANFMKPAFTQNFGGIMALAFSPDGELLITGDKDRVRLWRVNDCQHLLTCVGHTRWIRSVAFSSDGQKFASGSDDCSVRIWDSHDGTCLKILQEHTDWVRSVAFSPDGQWLASGSLDHTVRIWNVRNGTCFNILQGHDKGVQSVSFSPDGQWLVSGSDDCTVRIWNIRNETCLKILRGHSGRVRSVAFSFDGQQLTSGSEDRTIRIWNVDDGTCFRILKGHEGKVRSVVFSPNQHYMLASSSEDCTVRIWDIRNGKYINNLLGHIASVRSVAFSPDGNRLASGSEDQIAKIWNVHDGTCLNTLQGYTDWVLSVVFSPNGQTFASGSEDRTIRIWNVDDRTCLKTPQEHSRRIWSVAFSPNGQKLASGSDDHTVRIWDVHKGACLKTLKEHTNGVRCVVFSPDGQTIASGSDDQTIKLWDVSNGSCFNTLEGHTDGIWTVTFNPDGLLLASGSWDRTIRIWDTRNGAYLHTLEQHSDSVLSVMFSPDGQRLASGSWDHTVKIWNAANWECLHTLEGHKDRVLSVAFSPDGNTIASSSYDYTVRFWDTHNGKHIKTLEGHSNRVWSVAFSPNGQTLASSSENEIKLWDVETGECVKSLNLPKPYEDMNIFGVTGLTDAQKATLKALGAIEKAPEEQRSK